MELIPMTATYSNAVLMMVLTNVTDVATKLDVPIIKPVQPSQVRRFVCDSRKDSVGGWVTLTNGYQFWFDNGYVDGMDSAQCYFHLQDPNEIPRFYGTIRMTEAEAVQMAKRTINKLGYNPPWLIDEKPVVERAKTAPRDEPNVVPRVRVKWRRIEFDGRTTIAEIEINLDAKRPEMFWLHGATFWREPPNIPQPPAIPQPPLSPPSGGTRLTPLAENQRTAATNEICGKVTEMVKRLGLPVPLPIRPIHIEKASIGFLEGDLRGSIVLVGGYRFTYRGGVVTTFYAPNSDTNEGADPRRIYGVVRYTKQQIRDFATQQVRKLGFADSDVFLNQPVFVGGGPDDRNPSYARFRVQWNAPGTESTEDPGAQFTLAEVDGMNLELMSLWLRSTNLYRPSIIKP